MRAISWLRTKGIHAEVDLRGRRHHLAGARVVRCHGIGQRGLDRAVVGRRWRVVGVVREDNRQRQRRNAVGAHPDADGRAGCKYRWVPEMVERLVKRWMGRGGWDTGVAWRRV